MKNVVPKIPVVIGEIETGAEFREVEELQREVWGIPDLDVVPASQLIAAKAAGGVLIGAFDGKTLVGFVYGFVGYEHGQAVHHSHMLAVRNEYRNHDLGYRLKLAQRERVLEQGIDIMTWTFDPLQSLNAYLNFNKFGVVSNRYLTNFYGEDAPSFLHRNGTDRLWVTWLLSSQRVNKRLKKRLPPPNFEGLRRLVLLGKDDLPQAKILKTGLSDEQVLIEIPRDINYLEKHSSEIAFRWREATREAFTKALKEGYLVEEFYREGPSGGKCGAYLLSPGKGPKNIE